MLMALGTERNRTRGLARRSSRDEIPIVPSLTMLYFEVVVAVVFGTSVQRKKKSVVEGGNWME